MQAITTDNEQSFELVLEKLEAELRLQGNTNAARKADELLTKYRSHELVLAFCGHFSAGKSSLMNWLCGHQVLPTSPVPTTANIASIRDGDPRAIVHTHDGGTLDIDLQELDEYCKNGGDYEAVELWDHVPLLGKHGVLLDTPGVDSTDDAHEAATYSALHRADVVFYVMDYNHVQSETNLSFARTLYERGKPLYLIVNQIDKHEDQELPFTEYSRAVEQAFARRGIEPAGVLYVSRMAPEHEYGKLERLRSLIGELLVDHRPLVHYSVLQAAWELAEEHGKWLRQQGDQDKVQAESLSVHSTDTQGDVNEPANNSMNRNMVNDSADTHTFTTSLDDSPSQSSNAVMSGDDSTFFSEEDEEQDGDQEEYNDDLPALQQKLTILQQQEQETAGQLTSLKDKWAWEIGRLVEQANLTPSELRDLAQLYLEGERPGFKKGLFASKEKTLQERQQRTEAFLEAFRKQVTANLDVHVRGLLRGWSREHELWNEQQESELTSSLPQISEQDIATGAGKDMPVSGEYVLNYTRALREQTAARYRRAALDATDRLLDQLRPANEQQLAGIRQQVQHVEQLIAVRSAELERERRQQEQEQTVRAILPEREQGMPSWLPAIHADAAKSEHATDATMTGQQTEAVAMDADDKQMADLRASTSDAVVADHTSAAQHKNHTASHHAALTDIKGNVSLDTEHTVSSSSDRMQRLLSKAEQLRTAAGWIHDIPGLTSQAAELRRRAEVMENGKFTLALFGAFSAGKSSFANALLGGPVLPVSPHPMTAAITQIMSSDEQHPHATAVIYMKSAQELQEDISGALRLLGLPDRTLDQDWSRGVSGLNPARIHPSARAHYNFVLAAAAGWDKARHELGQALTVDMQQFRGYVSDEQQSCFVRRVDLYYDCPLTLQGMVLVDTPGADSVNARHTGVTFEYMKSADALVFVTYYNHAFTAGDRQLLEQLGRVKGSLALDNMFFIVNASDLASSEEEKQQVVGRIQQELNGAGIREPHIYSLSSRRALQGQDEGFRAFHHHFMSFADETLAGLAVHAADEELHRIHEVIISWQEAAQRGEAYRAERRQQLIMEQAEANRTISAIAEAEPDRRIQEESAELLFHVRQRLKLKTLDWIPEIFNPAQLNQESADLKADFAACGRELQRRLGIELEQEVLATTLRMEKAARRLIMDRMQTYGREAEKQAPGLRLSPFEPTDWQTPELPPLLAGETLNWKSFWPLFRNPRYFFEQGGRDKVRNQLSTELDQLIGKLLDGQRDRLATYYIDGLGGRLQQTAEELQRQISEWAEGTEASLQMADGPERWQQLATRLEQLHVPTSQPTAGR
ncbi:dynamin family protein [Paenibacillus kandeliae]|uniref:dynamin family protein n=1 Tax=Paenibacillus kandeliae TaxID=3231269 RepID=UPI003457D29E